MNKTDINNQDGIFEDYSNNNFLLVAFGGIRQGLGIPVFEFFNSLRDIPCDKIFFRDFNQSWYQNGVDERLNSVEKIVYHLKTVIEDKKYKKVCFIGNSMGGYGAILFGTLLNVDKIYAFAPQSFIDKKNRLINLDFRWKKQISQIVRNKNNVFLDLNKHLKELQNLKSDIIIYYSKKHRLDSIHANHISKIKNVHLVEYSKGGHDVVKSLRDEGVLNEIIRNAFL
jgi:esterase/lipase